MVIKAIASFKAFTFADLMKQIIHFQKWESQQIFIMKTKIVFVQKMAKLAFSLKIEI